jgi:small subunit ribosomal protein S1
MSTEPQLARVVQQPEQTGSAPQQAGAPDAIHETKMLATAPGNSAGRLDPTADAQRNNAHSDGVPSPAAASMTGRPAFPDKRDQFQLPDRREPVGRVPLETPAAPAPAVMDEPAATPVQPAAVSSEPLPGADASLSRDAESVASEEEPVATHQEPAAQVQGPAAAPQEPVAESSAASAQEEPGVAMPGIPVEATSSQEALAAAEMEALSYDELMADYGEPAIHSGDLCQGRIISIDGDNVIVDYGGKTEGVVPLAELQQGGIAEPAAGQSIEVSVESLGGAGDYAVLSFLKAHRSRLWEQVETAFRQKEELLARVTERVKGGLTVDIGIPAFLPGSQADVRPVPDLDSLVGQDVPVRIVKLSRSRGNVVVSRRALLEEELQQRREQTLAGLSEGATVSGTVKSVTNYGGFIDLGGIDGLLHVTDISWGRVRNPAEVLHVGEEITLRVLKFDAAKERVSLSLKHLQPDPWENIEQRYHEGGRATGRVVSITDYGAFVELDPGLEGLIHVSELSWSKRLKHPSKVLKLEQQVEAVITQMNSAERRISLSLKRLQPDPWVQLSERYPLGLIVEGRVRNLTSYGAFVEVEEGVDGLIHVSDLSWSSRVKHPKDELKKGQVVRAVVLHVDEENRRVSLGVKQLEPDVWEKFFSLHLVGDDVKGQITRFAKFGAFVELAPGVEGLCHNSEMSAALSKQRKPALRAGQEYEFRIIKLDEFDRKISLSRRAYEMANGHAASNGKVSAAPVETPSEVVHSFSEESA